MQKGRLFLLPTPIGDAPMANVLPEYNRQVTCTLDYFVVENLRSARRFLSRVGIEKPIDSLHFAELNEHTSPQEVAALIEPILAGHDMGLLSEAGVPAVADPGADLVRLAHQHGVEVVPLVGPSSIILALMSSGLNGQSFAFNGYLPIKQPERAKTIRHFERRAQTESQSQIFIEAPYRNLKLFEDMLSACSSETLLTVAADILQDNQLIRTAKIREWKSLPIPEINKRPTIFIIG